MDKDKKKFLQEELRKTVEAASFAMGYIYVK